MPDPALHHLAAPADPRSGWDLAAFGTLDRVTHLDEVATRIVADNPSPMTLDGTDTYVLGVAGSGRAAIVDPGPDDPAHLAAVREELVRRDAACELVLVTHHHHDHTEAAGAWAKSFGARLLATTPAIAETGGSEAMLVRDGDRFELGGLTIEAVATPGHTADHVAYRLSNGALLTGDHILGRGTSVITHQDGDLLDYLASLRRVLALGPHALYPGHGPELTVDPSAVVTYYLDHRAFRERQVLLYLGEQPSTPGELVRRIYVAVDPVLWPAAEVSTIATLDKLANEGRVAWDGDRAALVS